MARVINAIFNAIGRGLTLPLQGSAWLAMITWSLLITVAALLAFKFASSPAKIAAARNKVFAYILEFRVFKDDILGVFSIFGRVLWATAVYMKHYLMPIAVLIVPVILLLIQMSLVFDYRPLRPGEQALVTVTLDPDTPVMDAALELKVPDGIAVETEALRATAENQAVWRIRATGPTAAALEISLPGETVAKSVLASDRAQRISSVRRKGTFFEQLAEPAEPPVPAASAITSIRMNYPHRELRIAGMDPNWLVTCFVLTIVLGLLLRPVFKVEF